MTKNCSLFKKNETMRVACSISLLVFYMNNNKWSKIFRPVSSSKHRLTELTSQVQKVGVNENRQNIKNVSDMRKI